MLGFAPLAAIAIASPPLTGSTEGDIWVPREDVTDIWTPIED